MTDLPIIVTLAGPQPTPPATIRQNVVDSVSATNADYTANLPASMVEDVLSTEVASIAQCDSALVETINSITPFGANAFLLNQLGVGVYGLTPGGVTNTSVEVLFTGTPGFVIAQGFVVSDGTYQYVLSDGGIIGASGTSSLLSAIANVAGSWAVPSGTVQNLITSVPSAVSLSVNNPSAGLPGGAAETETQFRARMLQAGLASAPSMASFLRTQLQNIPGVQARLVSVLQIPGNGGWEVVCGGGDNYQVAYAILLGMGLAFGSLVGSELLVSGITNASPGVVTTTLNHGFTSGQMINISGVVGMTAVNNTPLTVTVLTPTTFSIGVNTTTYPAYLGGGLVTPNFRNVYVSVNDYPDTYGVVYVSPPAQTVTMTVTWNTLSTNYVSPVSIAASAGPAIVNYVNSIVVGQPINVFELNTAFQVAVQGLLPPQLLTRLVFAIDINGVGVSPEVGTGIVAGDPESYFLTNVSLITISQG